MMQLRRQRNRFGIAITGAVFLIILRAFNHPTLPGASTTPDSLQKHVLPGATNTPDSFQKHIAFCRIPKTGSTTLRNIIQRFGLKHNLTIYVNYTHAYVPPSVQEKIVEEGTRYDIFAEHTVCSKMFYRRILPEDYVTIGLVRNPVDRMISAAYYSRASNRSYLLKIPKEQYIKNLIYYPEKYDTGRFSATKNTMGHFFGFPSIISASDHDKIRTTLHEINAEFLFVLVLERIDESLVYLKRLLNWSFTDILYEQLNQNSHEEVFLSDGDREKIKQISFIDNAVYNFFLNEFEKKINSAGNDFKAEVDYFRKVLGETRTFCQNGKSKRSGLFFPQSKWESAFTVSNNECKAFRRVPKRNLGRVIFKPV